MAREAPILRELDRTPVRRSRGKLKRRIHRMSDASFGQEQSLHAGKAPSRAVSEIPCIDLGPYLAGERGALEALVAQLRFAQEEVGFYYIANHGVPRALIQESFGALKSFFSLPEAEKLSIRMDKGMSGYLPPKSTIYKSWKLTQNTKPDLNEAYILRRDVGPDDPSVLAGRREVNKWPAALPQFRPAMTRFHAAMEGLGQKMLPLIARTLGKPADFFAPMFTHAHFVNRNGYYPPVEQHEENQFGIAPHADHSFVTLLPVSEVPGLEIMTKDGEWIAAPAVEGTILVNTGESLTRFSNGVFRATPHRVLPPSRDRYALAFFYNPNDEALLDPVDTCVSEAHPRQYEPMSFIDFLAWRQKQNYLHMDKGGSTPNA
jgi:isopenicillin N synthase-like dioxygenase